MSPNESRRKRPRTVKRFWELVLYNVVTGFKADARNYALGNLWWVAEPALHLLILFFMLRHVFGGGDGQFAPFLFCGIVPWIWFSKSIFSGTASIFENRHIIRDTRVNKLVFPTITVLRDLIRELPVLLILMTVLPFMGIAATPHWLQLPLVVALQIALIAGIVYCAAMIMPYLPDVKYIIATGLQLLMFASGTFYDYKAMSASFQSVFLLNPVAVLINLYRDALMYQKLINPMDALYVAAFAAGFALLAAMLRRKLDADLPTVLYR